MQRARIVLLAAQGTSNAAIARACQCAENTVRKWRSRFAARPKIRTLKDDMRTGRPSTIPMIVRLELVKLACDRPAKCKLPFREVRTLGALRAALRAATGVVVSKSEIRRILADEEIRPRHVRLWLHSPDPDFRRKVRAICEVYVTPPAPGDTVLCIDEKTGMQRLSTSTRSSSRSEVARVGGSSSTSATARGRCSQRSIRTPASSSASAPSDGRPST